MALVSGTLFFCFLFSNFFFKHKSLIMLRRVSLVSSMKMTRRMNFTNSTSEKTRGVHILLFTMRVCNAKAGFEKRVAEVVVAGRGVHDVACVKVVFVLIVG